MYAGTKVNWYEILMPDSNKAALDESLPLFLCAFSADKGPEEITDLVYSDFVKLYGQKPNFFKYGQPLIQAHKILRAGGRVLGKRIVASDATLANLIITAEVSSVTENKVNEKGAQIYLTPEGLETTEVTETPATINVAKIKYNTVSAENITDFDQAREKAHIVHSDSVFPLFIICDNGRGESIKKVRISGERVMSKKLNYMMYRISDIENTVDIESARFAIDPDVIAITNGSNKSMNLTKNTMLQFNSEIYDPGMNAFLAKIAEITGYTVEDLYTLDILFGKTTKQTDIPAIKIDPEGTDFSVSYGLALESGSNGDFGDRPFPGEKVPGEEDPWTIEAVKFFNGDFDAEIFDRDQHKIDFCVDANYPDLVKASIVELAEFRGDFYYFRDLGLNIHSVSDVVSKIEELRYPNSCFVGDYASTYDIIDPYSRKQIKVTENHGMSECLVQHFIRNVAAPIAGEFNNFVITEAIEGTLNFIPRVTPKFDQKEILDDLKVNYLNLTSDRDLSIQSTYTSQDHNGPLSYANNVIVTQMVIKAIRRYCPKIRFMLMEPGATDFSKYKALIEDNVINRYADYFKHIELKYTRDEEMIANKVFNASLYCYYRDFPQGEIFDVFSVEGSPSSNPIDGLGTHQSILINSNI